MRVPRGDTRSIARRHGWRFRHGQRVIVCFVFLAAAEERLAAAALPRILVAREHCVGESVSASALVCWCRCRQSLLADYRSLPPRQCPSSSYTSSLQRSAAPCPPMLRSNKAVRVPEAARGSTRIQDTPAGSPLRPSPTPGSNTRPKIPTLIISSLQYYSSHITCPTRPHVIGRSIVRSSTRLQDEVHQQACPHPQTELGRAPALGEGKRGRVAGRSLHF